MRTRLALVALMGLGAAGCTAHAEENRHLTLADLPGQSTSAGGAWESAPWAGATWISYEGHLTLEVDHSLGRRPFAVLTYLSFDPSGGGAALAAGDLARVIAVTDTSVTIRNDTDGDYFVRLVLQ